MNEPASSDPSTWLVAIIVLVLIYRAAMATLLEAFHALPSLQRRRLLDYLKRKDSGRYADLIRRLGIRK